jgi:hypothetical protein
MQGRWPSKDGGWNDLAQAKYCLMPSELRKGVKGISHGKLKGNVILITP